MTDETTHEEGQPELAEAANDGQTQTEEPKNIVCVFTTTSGQTFKTEKYNQKTSQENWGSIQNILDIRKMDACIFRDNEGELASIAPRFIESVKVIGI